VDIAGKVALVTGAATGIGRATAIALAEAGAAVVAVDRNVEGAQHTADAIVTSGGRSIAVGADVSRPDDIRAMFAAAEVAFGGVDIVHNNAGLIGGEPTWPASPLEKIMAVIAVNLGGVAMGTQEAITAMRRRGGGVIINTASTAALAPMPIDPVYSATKVGVVRITESCAGLASEGIRVNSVLPGMVDTDMTNKHTGDGTQPAEWLKPIIAATTMLRPEDIADAVLELIRDDSAVAVSKVVSTPGRG
jgi:NAD(P)-dependent dehydrogenase (short-subunit alcohol dehydrogenase family)